MALIMYIQRGDSSGSTNKIQLKCEECNGRITRGISDWSIASIPSVGSWNPQIIDFGKLKYVYILTGEATISEVSDLIDASLIWWESKKYVKFTWKTEDELSNSFSSDDATINTDRWWKDVRVNIAAFDYKETSKTVGHFTWTLTLVRGERFLI